MIHRRIYLPVGTNETSDGAIESKDVEAGRYWEKGSIEELIGWLANTMKKCWFVT